MEERTFTKAEVRNNRIKWLNALESGKFKQTRGRLSRGAKGGGTEYCCLGVACHLFKGLGRIGLPPGELSAFGKSVLGMSFDAHDMAQNLNDGSELRNIKKHSFKEIAAYFRKLWKIRK